jgi:hypothetical protein
LLNCADLRINLKKSPGDIFADISFGKCLNCKFEKNLSLKFSYAIPLRNKVRNFLDYTRPWEIHRYISVEGNVIRYFNDSSIEIYFSDGTRSSFQNGIWTSCSPEGQKNTSNGLKCDPIKTSIESWLNDKIDIVTSEDLFIITKNSLKQTRSVECPDGTVINSFLENGTFEVLHPDFPKVVISKNKVQILLPDGTTVYRGFETGKSELCLITVLSNY